MVRPNDDATGFDLISKNEPHAICHHLYSIY